MSNTTIGAKLGNTAQTVWNGMKKEDQKDWSKFTTAYDKHIGSTGVYSKDWKQRAKYYGALYGSAVALAASVYNVARRYFSLPSLVVFGDVQETMAARGWKLVGLSVNPKYTVVALSVAVAAFALWIFQGTGYSIAEGTIDYEGDKPVAKWEDTAETSFNDVVSSIEESDKKAEEKKRC